ncbi:hypothetical protein SAMN05216331_11933 [Porphyromonadaceae bacterium KH3R12]|nr:hypothetical protein SAMN05216331_11933 [Porphyromonadaceae bacterium KH3R12]
MKKIYLILFILPLLFAAQSCDKELPYPIDDVKRGVVIDIVRSEGTDGVLYRGQTDGNFKVMLSIPEQQGDYSFLKHGQLFAVLERVLPDPTEDNPDRTKTVRDAKVVVDNITTFPTEITIDMADVYSKFGLTTPDIGETLYFTTNAVLKDDYVVPGWTEHTGFNNRILTGWRVNDRAYSYNVRYSVVCELVLDDFVGTCIVTEDTWWEEVPHEVEVTKVSDTQLSIAGLFNGQATNPLIITINPVDYSISFDKQILVPNSGVWWGNPAYNNFAFGNGTGIVDACDTKISFEATASVDAGTFSGTWTIVLGK